ncbi:MAG: thioredoxin domain-containing protein [Gemmatimonadales bacterium]
MNRQYRTFLVLLVLMAAVLGAILVMMAGTRDARRTGSVIALDLEGTVNWVIGSPDAPIEVIEGSDLQCPDCKRYEEEAKPAIRERFVATGAVRWRYLFFALPGHDEAIPATHALACAIEQGDAAADAMKSGIFATQAEWSRQPTYLETFRAVAAGAVPDPAAWDTCTASGRHVEAATHGWRAAQAAGIPGTPTVILFDRFYVGGLTANQLGRVLDAGRP